MRIIGNRGNTARKVQAVASGTLASGGTVVVNADGTVSVIEGVAAGVGSATVFEAATTNNIFATFDSNSNKVVIIYQDGGNSSYGTAIVGTVSGTGISFGSPVVFDSTAVTYTTAAFDSNSNKVVIAYKDNGNIVGTAVVGTVSGTNISFGTAVVYENANAQYNSLAFDSNSNKVVIAYKDIGNSSYGTAIVGTVSGTGISFGSPVVFESAATSFISATFDSNSNKVVIAYSDAGNSNYGTAIIGTVSGTGISFGSPVVFESAYSTVLVSTFDSNSNKVVIAYKDNGNSSYGTAVVGTVSGTSISFGTAVVFQNVDVGWLSTTFDSSSNQVIISYRDNTVGNGTLVVGTVSGTSISFDTPLVFNAATTYFTAAAFDSNSNKTVIAYRNSGNSHYGTAVVFQTESTNLTAENYIGIASNGYGDTKTATINVKGFIDDNQSGLTAGQSYYVQTNGDLGLTAADPSVFAGTAVSATKLIVKG